MCQKIIELTKNIFMKEEVKHSDLVNSPDYYKSDDGKLECIDAMEIAFGKEAVYWFCRCNMFKYNWRTGSKGGAEEEERDLKKIAWYANKAAELKAEMREELLASSSELPKDSLTLTDD